MNFKNIVKKGLLAANFQKITALSNTCYIMTYHMVPKEYTKPFEKQVRHLVENYKIVPVTEIGDKIKSKSPLRGMVALTFDDGFKDNFTNAFPILKKYNIPATVYLITDCIENGTTPWFIKFRQAFFTTSKIKCELMLGDATFSLSLKTATEREKSSDEVMAFLQKCRNQKRIEYLEEIHKRLKPNKVDQLSEVMMNWGQVREMHSSGIRFGAHTHTHPVLSSLDLDEAESEILTSKHIIETRLDSPVDEFAYPVGRKIHYTEQLIPILKKNGFKYAVTTSKDKISYGSNIYALSRPYPWDA